MQINIPHAVIVTAYRSNKAGKENVHYLDIRTQDGDTFDFSTEMLSPEQAKALILVPVAIQGSISGSKFEGKQFLKLVEGKFTPLAAK
jgi:hypothetical protein